MRENYQPFGLHEVESKEKKLVYTQEAKNFIKQNPGVLREAISMIESLVNDFAKGRKTKAIKRGGFEMTFLKDKVFLEHDDDFDDQGYFKFKVGKNSFFLKRQKNTIEELLIKEHHGINEIKSAAEAKDLVADLPWVEVLPYFLAYRDKKYSYYVSKWENITSVLGYFSGLPFGKAKMFFDDYEKKYQTLAQRLGGYADLRDNVFINSKRNKLILTDLHKPRAGNIILSFLSTCLILLLFESGLDYRCGGKLISSICKNALKFFPKTNLCLRQR